MISRTYADLKSLTKCTTNARLNEAGSERRKGTEFELGKRAFLVVIQESATDLSCLKESALTVSKNDRRKEGTIPVSIILESHIDVISEFAEVSHTSACLVACEIY